MTDDVQPMSNEAAEQPPYGVAAGVATAIFALYAFTIAPTTQFWDTSEYIAAAKVLGIPHPPGSPLFVLLANVWGQLPLAPHYALRINLFAAFTSALASGFLFLVADRFLRSVIADRWPRFAAAFAGVLVGATTFTVWNQSVVNAKVYTVSLFFIAFVFWLVVRWADLPRGPARDKILLLIGYMLVLTSTNHMMGVLVAPAVLVYVALSDWRDMTRPWVIALAVFSGLAITGKWTAIVSGSSDWRVLSVIAIVGTLAYAAWRDPKEYARPLLYAAIGAAVVGISLNFVFLPLRAAAFPPINEGEPTTWDALLAVLTREQYQKPPLSVRMADFPSQLGNYVQYFSWQFGHDWSVRARHVAAAFFGLLALYGAFVQWTRDRRAALAMIGLMLTVTVVLIYYLNFRYGYSYRAGETLDREVRERDYFFVISFQLLGLWVAMGLGALYAQLQAVLRTRLDTGPAWGAASSVLLIALIPFGGNRLTAPRAGETLARDFAIDLLQSVEPYAILITAGDNDLFPLWYAQEVERVRRDVLVFNQSLMNTEWHLRQLIRREVEPFDLVNAAPPYTAFGDLPPEDPVLDITVDGVDSLPLVWDVPQRSVFRVGSLEAVLEAGRYSRADLITLQLIRNNLGKRPIYFARTTGGTADQLGLTAYLLAEGFVRRVKPEPVEETDSIFGIAGIGWLDLDRTERLLFDVYHPESAARDRPRGWVDGPSNNILSLYYVTYGGYAQIVSQLSDSTDTDRLRLANVASELAGRMLEELNEGG